MEIFGFSTVLAITVIAWLVGEIVKGLSVDSKWIPVICGVVGGLLGIPAMMLIANYPASDYITAVAVGIASGFAATGMNEAFKQLSSKD